MRLGLISVLCLAMLGTAKSQVTVELILRQDQFLRDESLPLAVRIINQTGQALDLGRDSDWLTFSLVGHDQRPLAQTQPLDVVSPFRIESSAAAVKYLDLMPGYDLSQPGRFRVQAIVQVPGWPQAFVSKEKTFLIGRGVESWVQEFGYAAEADAPTEVRRYALLQTNYGRRPVIYARVTDPQDLEVYGVVPLGPAVSFSRPEKIIGRGGHLHVLFQSGARHFLYCEVTPEGKLTTRQTYSISESRPSLRNREGVIEVDGGVRRIGPDDFPAPEPEPVSVNADPSSP